MSGSVFSYEQLHPVATLARWRDDPAFLKAYEAAKDHTMVDIYRCFELWELVRETAKVPGDILEVGTWRGGSGAILAQSCHHHGLKSRVFLCDTFAGIVKGGEHDPVYRGGELADTSPEIVEDLIRQLELSNVSIYKGTFPDDTGDQVDAPRIRLCHVDVDVYQGAADITEWVWPRLPVGGVIVYDDYGFPNCRGVARFVEEDRERHDRIVLANLNGHAITMKIAE